MTFYADSSIETLKTNIEIIGLEIITIVVCLKIQVNSLHWSLKINRININNEFGL